MKTSPIQALKGRHIDNALSGLRERGGIFRFAGRCPTLLLKGFQPNLRSKINKK
jgi:hypothetical protein